MPSQRFSNPAILAFVGADEDDEIVPGRVVGVQEVCDYA